MAVLLLCCFLFSLMSACSARGQTMFVQPYETSFTRLNSLLSLLSQLNQPERGWPNAHYAGPIMTEYPMNYYYPPMYPPADDFFNPNYPPLFDDRFAGYPDEMTHPYGYEDAFIADYYMMPTFIPQQFLHQNPFSKKFVPGFIPLPLKTGSFGAQGNRITLSSPFDKELPYSAVEDKKSIEGSKGLTTGASVSSVPAADSLIKSPAPITQGLN